MRKFTSNIVWLAAVLQLAACAGIQSLVSEPEVRLNNVSVTALDFSQQTFLLSFDVRNPNAFELPINYVSYGVKLNQQQFASGETNADIRIPANGSGSFAISVELDLLHTAPQLLYTVRDGFDDRLAYELSGKLGVDLPLVEQLKFRSSGELRVDSLKLGSHNWLH